MISYLCRSKTIDFTHKLSKQVEGDSKHLRLFKAAADTQKAIDAKLVAGDYETFEHEEKLEAAIDLINPSPDIKVDTSSIN